MDCVFIKARKISKSLKGNRGSVVNYSKYLTRELQGVDYKDKGRILDCGIVGTDEKILTLWQKAENRENQTKRKDSARFAKEYILALPHQLPIEEQNKICKTVAKYLSQENRVVAYYQHEPDKEGDDRNFHCHFLMSERSYENGVFADKKNRTWNEKAFLSKQKKEIGQEINMHLERLGLEPIKIEIEEEKETKENKTEKQIRAERALKKRQNKLAKKEQLAEVKLNGLRGFIDRPTNTVGAEQTRNNNGTAKITEQINDLKHRKELERLRLEQARRMAEERARAIRRRAEEIERKNRDKSQDNGYSR